MAATNFTPIQLYFSTTASAAPTAANLAQGELAINITDGKLYYEDNTGVVQVIATKGAGTIGGSTTQIQYNNAGALAGNAAMVFNNSTNVTTLTTLNLTNALGAIYGGTAQSAYTQGDFLYASATNTLSKLGIGTVNYILTSSGSVPQWSAPSSIIVQTATNLAGGLAGSVPYQSALDTTTFLAIGAANRVMTSTGSAPQWVTSLTGLTGVSSSSITNTSLTSGRVVISSTAGLESDSANLTFNGTTLTTTGLSNSGFSTLVKTLTLGDSSFNGTAVFAAATPAKLYLGTGTVTDVTSAISATNTTGAIASLAITPIAATNTGVTYTNASTLYIAGAPSAGTNITITNPYSLYVAGGAVYLGGNTAVNGTLSATNTATFNKGATAIDLTPVSTAASARTNISWTAKNASSANRTTYIGSNIFLADGSTEISGEFAVNLMIDGVTKTALTSTGLAVTGLAAFGGALSAYAIQVTTTGNNGININNGTNQIFLGNTGGAASVGTLTAHDFQVIRNAAVIGTYSATGLAVTGTLSATGTLSGGTSGTGYSFSGSAPATSLTLDSSGNLGIGTSSPWAKLSVTTTNGNFGIANGNTSGGTKIQSFGTTTITNGYLAFEGYTAEYGRFDSSGNLGIGTTSPVTKLQVDGTSAGALLDVATIRNGSSDANSEVGIFFNPTSNTTNIRGARIAAINNGSNDISLKFYTGQTSSITSKMLISPEGNVGIGTSSPFTRLESAAARATTLNSIASFNTMAASVTDTTAFAVGVGGGINFRAQLTASTYNTYASIWSFRESANTSDYKGSLIFGTSDNSDGYPEERMRLDSSGNLGLGVTPSAWYPAVTSAIQVGNTGVYHAAGTTGFSGSQYAWLGNNGYFNSSSQWIYTRSTPAAQYLQFDNTHVWNIAASGTAGNAITFTQAMTLNSSGELMLGTTTSALRSITVGGAAATISLAQASGGIFMGVAGTPVGSDGFGSNAAVCRSGGTNFHITGSVAGDLCIAPEGTKNILFGTSASANTTTERVRIDSSGNLLVGQTSKSQVTVGFYAAANGEVSGCLAGSTDATTQWNTYSTGAGAYRFYVGMGGTIFATSIVITAISDQRLKENIRDIDTGLSSIMALKPRRFDWKEGKGQDKKNAAGFIAQEFEEVFPECVSTSKAGEDGIEYKNINHETLIPTLVKAIQELKAEFDAYKASHP